MTDDEHVRLDASSLEEVDARNLRQILGLDLGLLMRPSSDGIRTVPSITLYFRVATANAPELIEEIQLVGSVDGCRGMVAYLQSVIDEVDRRTDG
jgi:hypothetical protein